MGRVVLALGGAQILFYLFWRYWRPSWGFLFYFDPRIALGFVEELMTPNASALPGPLRWLSAGALVAIGAAMAAGRRMLMAYIAFETLLAAATCTVFAFIFRIGLTVPHGLSPGELTLPFIVFVLFSAVPLAMAIWTAMASRAERS